MYKLKALLVILVVLFAMGLWANDASAATTTVNFNTGDMFAPNCFCKADVIKYNLAPFCGDRNWCNRQTPVKSVTVSPGQYRVKVNVSDLTASQKFESVLFFINGKKFTIPDLGGDSSPAGATIARDLGIMNLSGNVTLQGRHAFASIFTGNFYTDPASKIGSGNAMESVDIRSVVLEEIIAPPPPPPNDDDRRDDDDDIRDDDDDDDNDRRDDDDDDDDDDKKCKGSIGNLVWNDANGNGVQDKNEEGLSNIRVKLTNKTNDDTDTQTTNAKGHYKFSDLCGGDYKVEVKDKDVAHLTQTHDPDKKKDNKTKVTLEGRKDKHTKADFGYRSKQPIAPRTGSGETAVYISSLISLAGLATYLKVRKAKSFIQK